MSLAGEIRAGRAFVEIMAKDKGLQKGLTVAQQKLQMFVASVRQMSADIQQTLDLGRIIGSVVIDFSAFDDKMRVLQAVTGATNREIQKLTASAYELATATGFTVTEIAAAQIELAKLGFSANDVLDSMAPVLKMVRAVGAESFRLGEASEATAAILKDFNLSAKDTARICDIMAYAANRSAVDIFDLAQSLKIAGPLAYQVGDDIESVTAQLMVLSNAGIKGELAGTALRRVYQSIAEQSGPAANQLRELGISVTDSNGDLRSAIDVLSELSTVINRMRTGEKINFTVDVFDIRGTLGALPMFSAVDDLTVFQTELRNSAGTVDKAVSAIEGGLGGALRRLSADLDKLKKEFTETFAGVIQILAQAASSVINFLSPFISATKHITALTATMGAFLLVAGGVIKIFSIIADTIGSAVSVLRAFSALIGNAISSSVRMNNLQKRSGVSEEKIKALEKQKSDQLRIASESRRHYVEMRNIQQELTAVLTAEKQKLQAEKRNNPQNTSVIGDLETSVAKKTAELKKAAQATTAARNATVAHLASLKATNTSLAAQNGILQKNAAGYGRAAAYITKNNALRNLGIMFNSRYLKIMQVISVQELINAAKAAGASKLRIAGLVAEAVAVKALSVAYTALRGAILLIPMIILGLGSAHRDHTRQMLQNQKAAAAAQTESANNFVETEKEKLNTLIQNLKVLKEYNDAQQHSASDMTKAADAIADLQSAYGDLGVSIDRVTGKITDLERAQRRALKIQQESAMAALAFKRDSLDSELAVLFSNLSTGKAQALKDALTQAIGMDENTRLEHLGKLKMDLATNPFSPLAVEELAPEDAMQIIDDFKRIYDGFASLSQDEAKVQMDSFRALHSRGNPALSAAGLSEDGFKSQIQGVMEQITSDYEQASNINAYDKYMADADRLEEMAQRNLELYRGFEQEERNRLADLIVAARMQKEQELAKDDPNMQFVNMLTAEIMQGTAAMHAVSHNLEMFEQEIGKVSVITADMREKAAKELSNNHKSWIEYIDEISRTQAEELRQQNHEARMQNGNLLQYMQEAAFALQNAEKVYASSLENYKNLLNSATSAQGEGGQFITENESNALKEAQMAIAVASGDRDFLKTITGEIRQAIGNVQTSVLGSFSSAALDAMSGGVTSAEERTAKATEATAKGINLLHRDFGQLQEAYILGY